MKDAHVQGAEARAVWRVAVWFPTIEGREARLPAAERRQGTDAHASSSCEQDDGTQQSPDTRCCLCESIPQAHIKLPHPHSNGFQQQRPTLLLSHKKAATVAPATERRALQRDPAGPGGGAPELVRRSICCMVSRLPAGLLEGRDADSRPLLSAAWRWLQL